jgi:nucleotide-binding universal stress UspA family protein
MGTIVVGIDGSPQSLAALRFAAAQARARGATLHLVHAWSVPYAPIATAPFVVVGGLPELERAVGEHAAHVLDEALEAVGVGDVPVEKEVAQGDAAHALIEAAKGAEMLVVGSRGRGGFAGLLLGSVSQACVHHAPCPVVVIRGEVAGEPESEAAA